MSTFAKAKRDSVLPVQIGGKWFASTTKRCQYASLPCTTPPRSEHRFTSSPKREFLRYPVVSIPSPPDRLQSPARKLPMESLLSNVADTNLEFSDHENLGDLSLDDVSSLTSSVLRYTEVSESEVGPDDLEETQENTIEYLTDFLTPS